jgi:DtxR family transcriptional regulator, Mn-dependent transcriptional regulator
MQILKSSEDYLETMLMMRERHGYIRSIDIAAELGVTKPSVSYATKRLRENDYITMDRNGLITLTAKGLAVAERVYDRHKTLAAFLIRLGVDAETAVKDACKIEHDISDASFAAIRAQATPEE